MKILLTGKNGQLGRSIQKLISNFDPHEYTLVGREELDLSSSESISKYFDNNSHFDVIINCAAYTAVDKAEDEVDLAEKINYLAVRQIAEFANSQNTKLIHISTDYVFDGKNDSPYLESDKPNPINVYGRTKLLGERAILKTMLNNAIILRSSWVYSEFGDNFVKTILKLGIERGEINMVSDQIGSPTYATDLAEVILNIITNKDFINKVFSSEIYHFSNLGGISRFEFAKEIFNSTNLDCIVNPISSQQYLTHAKRPHNSILNQEKIKDHFKINIPFWKVSLKIFLESFWR